MRNAVIRKKRLKVERAYEDFMRWPIRFVPPVITDESLEKTARQLLQQVDPYRMVHLGIW